jgi:hypothetical protein
MSETIDQDPRERVVEPLVVRPRDACRMLSVGMTRLYELLNENALESYLHCGSRRITVSSIHAYIERQLAASRGGFRRRR